MSESEALKAFRDRRSTLKGMHISKVSIYLFVWCSFSLYLCIMHDRSAFCQYQNPCQHALSPLFPLSIPIQKSPIYFYQSTLLFRLPHHSVTVTTITNMTSTLLNIPRRHLPTLNPVSPTHTLHDKLTRSRRVQNP